MLSYSRQSNESFHWVSDPREDAVDDFVIDGVDFGQSEMSALPAAIVSGISSANNLSSFLTNRKLPIMTVFSLVSLSRTR